MLFFLLQTSHACLSRAVRTLSRPFPCPSACPPIRARPTVKSSPPAAAFQNVAILQRIHRAPRAFGCSELCLRRQGAECTPQCVGVRWHTVRGGPEGKRGPVSSICRKKSLAAETGLRKMMPGGKSCGNSKL